MSLLTRRVVLRADALGGGEGPRLMAYTLVRDVLLSEPVTEHDEGKEDQASERRDSQGSDLVRDLSHVRRSQS